ncbi:hypothetical protein AmDm5_3136 [Acetobacter malorum]|nr:hypothetical protein AmDm5_3136 [Acetobacter malorum]
MKGNASGFALLNFKLALSPNISKKEGGGVPPFCMAKSPRS